MEIYVDLILDDYIDKITDITTDFSEIKRLSFELQTHIFSNCDYRYYENDDGKQILSVDGWFIAYWSMDDFRTQLITKNLEEIEKSTKSKFLEKDLLEVSYKYTTLRKEIHNRIGLIEFEYFEFLVTFFAKSDLSYGSEKTKNYLSESPELHKQSVFNQRNKYIYYYELGVHRYFQYNSVRVERKTPICHRLILNGKDRGDIIKVSNNNYTFNNKSFYSFSKIKKWASLKKNIQ